MQCIEPYKQSRPIILVLRSIWPFLYYHIVSTYNDCSLLAMSACVLNGSYFYSPTHYLVLLLTNSSLPSKLLIASTTPDRSMDNHHILPSDSNRLLSNQSISCYSVISLPSPMYYQAVGDICIVWTLLLRPPPTGLLGYLHHLLLTVQLMRWTGRHPRLLDAPNASLDCAAHILLHNKGTPVSVERSETR